MKWEERIQNPKRRDESGATFVITAIAMVLLLWAGAMGVDLGFTVDSNQQAQSIADTGALDLTRYLNIADANPNINTYLTGKLANVSSDNPQSHATLSWAGGTWSLAAGFKVTTGGCYQQLQPNNPPCTAVKVTATQTVPRIFAGGSGSVTRSAVGYLNPTDSFSIGTYLANLNTQQGPVLNAILGQIASGSLSLVSYEGLADTYVTLNQLVAASSASGVVLTPTTIMTTSLTGGQWLSIFKQAASNQALNCGSTPEPSPCVAYSSLQSLAPAGGPNSVELCQLVSINGSNCSSGALSEAGLSSSVDLLQTLETEAELANNNAGFDLGTSLGLSGVTDAKLILNVVQPPQIAYGSVGASPPTSATSAQVQSTLRLFVTGIGEIDVALGAVQGTATLTKIRCSQSNVVQQVVVSASTTAATGAVTLIDPTLGVNQPIASTSVSGVSGNPFFTPPFPPTTSQAAAGTNPRQIGTTSPTLTISALGGLSSQITSLMAAAPVSTLVTQLQSALGGILQAAGVTAAGANVADLSANCASVSLAQ